ncbi:unnamed protein product [Brachionus calyciflorus]|uniref:Uncharacterized protein n=1 Tax=Brachionus calyciflorus TaxID=104777 RepID=A0A814HGC7_9BILA|nr:unnamed protein product [Brachionus calyciflorus]
MKSVTKEPTRIGIKSNRKGETNIKLSQIDHIICQDDLDPKSEVSSIKIRSDLSFDDCPENIQYGEISANSIPEQVKMFNSFFTNVESSSLFSEDESS